MSTIQFQQMVVPEGVIDLGVGQPDATLLPLEVLRASAAERLADGADNDLLQYGAEWGDGHHRVALGNFLTHAYGVPVEAEMLLSTNGNSQALDLVFSVFTQPGDVVLVEEPTYFLGRAIFASHGVRCVGVPMDADGLDVDAARTMMAAMRAADEPLRALYCIPAFHNPTGASLAAQRRTALVEACQEYDVLLIADEVYHLLSFDGSATAPPMSAHVDSGVVMSLGTFSKILAPGLRLGWIHAAQPLLDRLAGAGIIASGGGLNPFVSGLVTTAIRSGALARHVDHARTTLAHRAALMGTTLRSSLPVDVAPAQDPTGGYFSWLELPDGYSATAFRAHCQTQHRVDLRHGPLFSSVDGLDRNIRLSYAFYTDDDVVEGCHRVGAAFDSFTASRRPR